MTTEAICAVIACAVTVGGILIYLGRSLNTLSTIDANQSVLFKRSEDQGRDIVRIDKELTEVRTRQADCENCP